MGKFRIFSLTVIIFGLLILLSGCSSKQPKGALPHPITDQEVSGTNRGDLIQQLQQRDVQVVQVGGKMRLILPVDAFFQSKSNKVKPDQVATLAIIAALIKTYGDVHVKVTGHSDDVGSITKRLERSQQKANNVAAYLWADGIPFKDLQAIGYGDEKSVASDDHVNGSAANRRIEIRWQDF